MPKVLNSSLYRMHGVIWFAAAICAVVFFGAPGAHADKSEKGWQDLRRQLFGSRVVEDGSTELSLTAPGRADDPALVPVQIKILHSTDTANPIKTLSLIVDENPAPLAAVFSLAPDARISVLETRIRVNAYSFVRVVAEMKDGSLRMVKRYVKATGGCAAPASKNPDEALSSMGQMRLRRYTGTGTAEAELQLQIRHPNYSGLQMDQLTGLYRPAHFVQTIRITADGKPVISVEGAISLSENPTLRFKHRGNDAKTLAAHVEDSEGNVFERSWAEAVKQDGKDS